MINFFKPIVDQAFEEECYDAGYDSVKNGANMENCHFKFFTTPAQTAAWERGADDCRTADEKGQGHGND